MPASIYSTDPEVRARLRAIRCALACRCCERDAYAAHHNDIAYLLEHSTLNELERFWNVAAAVELQNYVDEHFHLCWRRACGVCRSQS
jgi:hypothetical protein